MSNRMDITKHGLEYNEDKERIRHALNGELPVRIKDRSCKEYRPAGKEECDKYILFLYDKAVYNCIAGEKMINMYNYIVEKNEIQVSKPELLISREIENLHDTGYEYEPTTKIREPKCE